MKACRHFLISGRVQGVFYRASAESAAQRLGVTGWVRNLADGRVEVFACGEAAPLQELEHWLWRGPPHARVSQVVTQEADAQIFDDFSIRG